MKTKSAFLAFLIAACITYGSVAKPGQEFSAARAAEPDVERRVILTKEYDIALMVVPAGSKTSTARALFLRHKGKKLCAVDEEPCPNGDGTLIAFQDARSRSVGIVNTKTHEMKVVLEEYKGLVRYYNWSARRGFLRLEYDQKQFIDIPIPEFSSGDSTGRTSR